MRKLLVAGIILLMLMVNIPADIQRASGKTLDDIHLEFLDGYGIRILISNWKNYSIYNVSLDNIYISGFFIFKVLNGIRYIKEITPHSYGYLVVPVFGLGWIMVTAKVSYIDHGVKEEKEMHAEMFLIGTVTAVIDQWCI